MSASSNYLENALLAHVLKNTTYSSPTTVYVALFNSDNSAGDTAANLEAGTLTDECGGGGYARQSASFGTVTNGSVNTDADITFPAATDANWGTITHVAVTDSVTAGAGNVLFYGALDSSREIQDQDTFQITSGSLTVTLA